MVPVGPAMLYCRASGALSEFEVLRAWYLRPCRHKEERRGSESAAADEPLQLDGTDRYTGVNHVGKRSSNGSLYSSS